MIRIVDLIVFTWYFKGSDCWDRDENTASCWGTFLAQLLVGLVALLGWPLYCSFCREIHDDFDIEERDPSPRMTTFGGKRGTRGSMWWNSGGEWRGSSCTLKNVRGCRSCHVGHFIYATQTIALTYM